MPDPATVAETDAGPDGPETPRLLFAYGTLRPESPDALARGGWEPDAARGRLYDLGPYPGRVDLHAPDAGWVEGFVRVTSPEEVHDRLDPYEGTDVGLFRREATATRAGRVAWVYVYPRPLPPGAVGPIRRWERSVRSWPPDTIERRRR